VRAFETAKACLESEVIRLRQSALHFGHSRASGIRDGKAISDGSVSSWRTKVYMSKIVLSPIVLPSSKRVRPAPE
jgi:hypothetical protein